MSHYSKYFPLPFLTGTMVLFSGCSMFTPAPTATYTPPPTHDMVANIRAAGNREKSIISVNALQDPGVVSLQEAAQRDEQAQHYADAAGKLDQALKLSPESPDLLQQRAEVAVQLQDYPLAEKLARQSWSLGPKLGPLCARNWQTVVEMRQQAGDQAGVVTARNGVAACHEAGIPRY